MSKAAYKLFKKSYGEGPSGCMPEMLLLAKEAGDALPACRTQLVDMLLSLRLEAPIEDWEEFAMWELKALLRRLNGICLILTNTVLKLEARVEHRWRAETRRELYLEQCRRERTQQPVSFSEGAKNEG